MKQKKINFKLNIRAGLLLFSLIPSFLLIIAISFAVSSSQWQKVQSKAENNLSKATIEINTLMDQAVKFSSNIISNSYIPTLIQKEHNSLKESYETFLSLDMLFSNYKENNAPLGTNIKIFHDNYSLYRSEYFNYTDVLDESLVKKLKSSKTADVFWTDENDSVCAYKALNTPTLTFIIQYKIPKSKINNILKTFDVDKNEGYDFPNTVTLYTKNSSKSSLSKTLYNGTYICLGIPKALKAYIYTRNILVFMLAFILLGVLLIIFSGIFSSKFKNSVSQFIDTIDTTGAMPPSHSFPASEDELSPVYGKIVNLVEEVNALHTKNTKIAEEKNIIELKYVQSQFNPHLLYNTLSVLKWECIKYDQSLGKVIQSMTEYYRSCISAYDEIVTLSDEIELVKKYISLMEFTHKKCYPLIINIEPDLKEFRTIKHLIQPFAENAVLHGIQQKDGGYIKLSASRKDEFVIIEISDNGTGIDTEKLKEIEKETYFSKYKSYGIKNTRERIRLFHGENSSIDIHNRDNGGAVVKIMIPL